jgi:hypothetical protein
MKTLAEFDYTQSPHVTAPKMRDLAESGYIERAEPVLFIGECGTLSKVPFSAQAPNSLPFLVGKRLLRETAAKLFALRALLVGRLAPVKHSRRLGHRHMHG